MASRCIAGPASVIDVLAHALCISRRQVDLAELPAPCTQVWPLVFVVVVVVLLIIYKAATRPVVTEAGPEELLRSLKDTVTPGAP